MNDNLVDVENNDDFYAGRPVLGFSGLLDIIICALQAV